MTKKALMAILSASRANFRAATEHNDGTKLRSFDLPDGFRLICYGDKHRFGVRPNFHIYDRNNTLRFQNTDAGTLADVFLRRSAR